MLPETTLDIPVIVLLLKGLVFLFLTLQLVIVFPKYEVKEKLIILLVLLFVILIGISTKRFGTVFSMYALIVGAKGIEFKRILKVYFVTGSTLCLTVVLMSYFGLIENRGFISYGHGISEISTIRYCMGYVWPTDFATHTFFVLFAYWVMKDGRMTIMSLLSFSIIIYLVYRISDSMLGCGCMLLLILFSFILKIRRSYVLKHSPIGTYSFKKECLWASYIPVLFVIMTYATYYYDSTDLNWIALDTALSGRLHISQDALEKEGITWLGQEYELMGGDTIKDLYNYIDSSYLQALVIYGIVFSLMLLLSYVYITSKAYRREDYTFLYAVLVAGVSGAIAQHFLQICMNPLWLAITAQFMPNNLNRKESLPQISNKGIGS